MIKWESETLNVLSLSVVRSTAGETEKNIHPCNDWVVFCGLLLTLWQQQHAADGPSPCGWDFSHRLPQTALKTPHTRSNMRCIIIVYTNEFELDKMTHFSTSGNVKMCGHIVPRKIQLVISTQTCSSSCVLSFTDGSILIIQHQLTSSLCNTPLFLWITQTHQLCHSTSLRILNSTLPLLWWLQSRLILKWRKHNLAQIIKGFNNLHTHQLWMVSHVVEQLSCCFSHLFTSCKTPMQHVEVWVWRSKCGLWQMAWSWRAQYTSTCVAISMNYLFVFTSLWKNSIWGRFVSLQTWQVLLVVMTQRAEGRTSCVWHLSVTRDNGQLELQCICYDKLNCLSIENTLYSNEIILFSIFYTHACYHSTGIQFPNLHLYFLSKILSMLHGYIIFITIWHFSYYIHNLYSYYPSLRDKSH